MLVYSNLNLSIFIFFKKNLQQSLVIKRVVWSCVMFRLKQNHIRESLKRCDYPGWACLKSTKRNKTEPGRDEAEEQHNGVVMPTIAGTSEKLRRIFNKRDIPVRLKHSDRLVHFKDKPSA